MTKFVQVVGSPTPFLCCLLLIIFSFLKGWVSSGGVLFALLVLSVLGVSSALISKRKSKS